MRKTKIAQIYELDCADNSDNFQSKYSWYKNFKEKVTKDWFLDVVCYNNELKKVVYIKSKLDLDHKYDPNRTSYGISQLGIYDVEKDKHDKAPTKNLGFYENCGIIKEWDKNNEVIYQCGAGDADVGNTSIFSYNVANKTMRLIEKCSIEAGRKPEKICSNQ